MSTDEKGPELATNDDWRGIMVRARKSHSLSQQDVADRLGTSQAAISKIESGEIGSTSLVLPICALLSIPLPEHVADAEDRDWMHLSRVLRHRRPAIARDIFSLMERVAEEIKAETSDVNADTARDSSDRSDPKKP
jgi:transcriptional regulator with XRE-family HTH domain